MIVLRGARERIERLSFAPCGNTLVVPSHVSVQIWQDVTVNGPPTILPEGNVYSVQFSPDGTKVILDGPNVRICDLATGNCQVVRFAIPPPNGGEVAISPDGQFFLTVLVDYHNDPRGRIVCRSLGNPDVDVWSVRGVYRFPGRPLFLPDDNQFLTREQWSGEGRSEFGPAWITREMHSGEVLSKVRERGKGYHLEMPESRDRSLFAARFGNRIRVYRTDDPRAPVHTITNDSRKAFTGAAFHPDGRILAVTSNDHTVKFFDIRSGAFAGAFDWGLGQLRSVAFNADGTLGAAGTDTGRVVIWDVEF